MTPEPDGIETEARDDGRLGNPLVGLGLGRQRSRRRLGEQPGAEGGLNHRRLRVQDGGDFSGELRHLTGI
jgi:hypothetical protein